jgi:hypothetical protein
MANVIVKMDIVYRVTQKVGNKEVSQKFVKKTANLGQMTEAQFLALHTATDSVNTIADFGDFGD